VALTSPVDDQVAVPEKIQASAIRRK